MIEMPKTYSQNCEDWLIYQCVKKYNNISYLDIGCNHPIRLSNTYLFYENGYRGTLVEPLSYLHDLIQKERPEDHLIKCAIGDGDKKECVIKMKGKFGTSSYITDDRWKGSPYCYTIPLMTINGILESIKKLPTFLTIDCEGYDLPILKSLDFKKYPIPVICAEYDKSQAKGIDEFMLSKGYYVRFKNHANTIYGFGVRM